MSKEHNKKELDLFWRLVREGKNIFLTGGGGVGKSYTIRKLIQEFSGRKQIALTASTGIAALNIGGMTVHSWAGILLGPKGEESNEAFYNKLYDSFQGLVKKSFKRIKNVDMLIIDEISMLDGRLFDYLNYHLKTQLASEEPFGGIQVICVGDFLQLAPVEEERGMAFQCDAWKEADFHMVHLQEVVRQSDPTFIDILNRIRHGDNSPDVLAPIMARVRPATDDATRILTVNAAVDKYNAKCLEDLRESEVRYKALIHGTQRERDYFINNLTTPYTLSLKVGAKVVTTCNCKHTDESHYPPMSNGYDFVNGMVGTVLRAERAYVDVLFDVPGEGRHKARVRPNKWVYDPYVEESGYFVQIPLRLAYAMTVHKSQGVTLTNAHVNITRCFADGQAYVALSRVTALEGLTLDGFKPSTIKANKAGLEFYANPEKYCIINDES